MTRCVSIVVDPRKLVGARHYHKEHTQALATGSALPYWNGGSQLLPCLPPEQSHLTLMTWIFSMFRVAASLVCTRTVKVQPGEAGVESVKARLPKPALGWPAPNPHCLGSPAVQHFSSPC